MTSGNTVRMTGLVCLPSSTLCQREIGEFGVVAIAKHELLFNGLFFSQIVPLYFLISLRNCF